MNDVPYVLWLSQISLSDLPTVGGKAARLGETMRQGMPVPDGFCLTQAAHQAFVRANGLDQFWAGASRLDPRREPMAFRGLEEALEQARVPDELAPAISQAYERLGGGEEVPVAVRSSASAEDWPGASFAGQQGTWLNVAGLQALHRAILACWASLWSPSAIAYRRDVGLWGTDVGMAVLVQRQVLCEAAGVAFSRDPLGEPDVVLVEASWGMGEGVVSGQGQVDRFWLDRTTLNPRRGPHVERKVHRWVPKAPGQGGLKEEPVPADLQQVPALTPSQVGEVASLALALERLLGTPQDVEFGFQGGQLFLLQSRPVTAQCAAFFDGGPKDEDRLWTAGFVNERFQQPVSPLGWTLIRPLLERLAFRDPLHYLGVHDLDDQAITRLHRGHPYVDVRVFQHLYKVFPDFLLPEDAVRYFPLGDVAVRRLVSHPRGWWDPKMGLSLFKTLLTQRGLCSPWHNYRRWMAFEESCSARLERLDTRRQEAMDLPDAERPQALWELVLAAQSLNEKLLSIHRWSLTLADILYTMLHRACRWSAGEREGTELTAALVADVETVSVQMNRALEHLARVCQEEGGMQSLHGSGPAAEALDAFLQQYGHRSYSLDVYTPPFADDVSQVEALVETLMQAAPPPQEPPGPVPWNERLKAPSAQQGWARWRHGPLRTLGRMTRIYLWLREQQRFVWQRVLAFQRRALLELGGAWVRLGHLPRAELIFFATLGEVRAAIQKGTPPEVARLENRRRTFERLRRDDAALPPAVAYPPFLRGTVPLVEGESDGQTLTGVVVSPGLAQGTVRIVRCPGDLSRVRPSDILVASAVDPGWTPVFSRLAGLILESGGQLSHGAVVAREYGLPALVGVVKATQLLPDGSRVLLDAHAGRVRPVRQGSP